jgi:hypothetical protein
MVDKQFAILASAPGLLLIAQQDIPPISSQSNRQESGYLGPVRKITKETEILPRKLYREYGNGQRKLIEDTTEDFGLDSRNTYG